MKWLLLSLLVLSLSGCTTENSQIQDVAIEAARHQFTAEIKKTADEKIKGNEILKTNMIEKIAGRTEFDVSTVDRSGSTAKVDVRVRTLPAKVREALMEIIAKIDPGKQNGFNIPDAIGMIQRQLGFDSEARLEQVRTIHLHKEGVWKADPEVPAAPAPDAPSPTPSK